MFLISIFIQKMKLNIKKSVLMIDGKKQIGGTMYLSPRPKVEVIMDISLEVLRHTDAKKLYEFELENRDYFEKMVPSRGEDYYNWESFNTRHEDLLDELGKGLSYFYLIKNENGVIVGRMNVVDIDKSRNLGYLGYRVGEAYTGIGIANKALKLLLSIMKEEGIKQILAKTTTNNIASQKILEKNGLKHISTSDEEVKINGQSLKFVNYQWTI